MNKTLPLLCLLTFLSPIAQADTSASTSESSAIQPAKKYSPAELKLLDRIAVVVNEDIILWSDLKAQLDKTKAELAAKGVYIQDELALEKKVLDSLILEKLQLQKAKQLGIQVTDEEVAEQIAEIAKQNNLTIAQLREVLNRQSPNGFIQFRDRLKKELTIQKLRQRVVLEQTQVTEQEIDNFIQRSHLQQNNWEYHLGHIMLALPESANAKQREKLKQEMDVIRQKLLAGEDFSQIAVRFSQGSKALQGGDLGWLSYDQMPTFFADKVTQLKKDELSPVIRSPVGYHLIKLLDKRSKTAQQGGDEREAALQAIRLRKANEVLELWLRQLRDEAFVEIKLPELAKLEKSESEGEGL
jgi:peptidyl-prolyl cis-trans isomerase SurA